MKSTFLRADVSRVSSVPVLFFGSSPCFPSFFFALMMIFWSKRRKIYTPKGEHGCKNFVGGGGSRKLSRVMRRGHFSKITFKGESTVSYRFKHKILRSPLPRRQVMTCLIGRLSHVTMSPPPPSPIVHELVRARSALTVANQGNAQKKIT